MRAALVGEVVLGSVTAGRRLEHVPDGDRQGPQRLCALGGVMVDSLAVRPSDSSVEEARLGELDQARGEHGIGERGRGEELPVACSTAYRSEQDEQCPFVAEHSEGASDCIGTVRVRSGGEERIFHRAVCPSAEVVTGVSGGSAPCRMARYGNSARLSIARLAAPSWEGACQVHPKVLQLSE